MLTDRTVQRRAATPLPPRLLAAIAVDAAGTALVETVGEPDAFGRTFACVQRTSTHDVWIIRWGAHSRAPLHDHGGSAGALSVLEGALVEYEPNVTGAGEPARRVLRSSDHRWMSPTHVHEVVNESNAVATSVHVYSPPLDAMHHYEIAGRDLRVVRQELVDRESAWSGASGRRRHVPAG